MGKLKIEINNPQDLTDLLRETYQLADEQIVQAQNEINKMATATRLQDESIEGKAKYGKIINDYLNIKDKAISKKLDIAKIMADVLHHTGGAKEGLQDMTDSKMDFNFDDIKKIVDESYQENDKTKTIELRKK